MLSFHISGHGRFAVVVCSQLPMISQKSLYSAKEMWKSFVVIAVEGIFMKESDSGISVKHARSKNS
jgi:hypothetical protein